jgi:hypothetical protein
MAQDSNAKILPVLRPSLYRQRIVKQDEKQSEEEYPAI